MKIQAFDFFFIKHLLTFNAYSNKWKKAPCEATFEKNLPFPETFFVEICSQAATSKNVTFVFA